MATLAELTREFDEFSDRDLRDNQKLISWLARAFDWATEQEHVELPGRDVFAVRIGMTLEIPPDPGMPMNSPQPNNRAGDPDFAAWLLSYGISLLVSDPASRLLSVDYWYFVTCAKDYFGVPQSEPIPK